MIHLDIQEGKKYTQVEEVEIKDRVVAEQLYIPDTDESKWQLISDEEAEEYSKQIREYEKSLYPEIEDNITLVDTDGNAATDRSIHINCPSCGRDIYVTPPTDSTEASTMDEDNIIIEDL